MRGLGPGGFAAFGRVDNRHGFERNLLLVLHPRAIDIVAPVPQPQAKEDAGGFIGGKAAIRQIENDLGLAARLVFPGDGRARFFEVRAARFVVAIPCSGEREAQDLSIALDKAFEQLAGTALEPCRVRTFAYRFLERRRQLALVHDLGKKARRFRTGLAELDVHGLSQRCD